MRVEEIRQSQFVLTYGPGAIRETRWGPRLILGCGPGLFGDGRVDPADLEIPTGRLRGVLGTQAHIFRPPPGGHPGWKTKRFPGWYLCPDHWFLYSRHCPECGERESGHAVRFVMACPAGHLDDVNWPYLLHGERRCAQEDGFRWFGGRGSVGEIELLCPACGTRRKLASAYETRWRCTGRQPEEEPAGTPPQRPGCGERAHVVQRQAINLRVPELVTVFTVPPIHTSLHRLLGAVRLLIETSQDEEILGEAWPDRFRHQLQNLARNRRELEGICWEILRRLDADVSAVQRAACDLLRGDPSTYGELLLDELHALLRAARDGVAGDADSGFEVVRTRIRQVRTPEGRWLRVVPVSRLRVLTVQRGYRRLVGSDVRGAAMRDIGWRDGAGRIWYPGMEYLGEGIFLMLDAEDGWHFGMKPDPAGTWKEARARAGDLYPDVHFRSETVDELDPVFVWWHTLSHLIIRAIGRYSGYSSTAVRERVYFEESGGRARGAVLLYASQPGSEAALGGLVGLVPRFEAILQAAWEAILYCSNGYLCDSNRFRPGAHGGAACYGCAVVSETCCEHRNLWLDRNLLLENPP
jgi:hypothetical protein